MTGGEYSSPDQRPPMLVFVDRHPAWEHVAIGKGAETSVPIKGASVVVLTGPNTQQGPIHTDETGGFRFAGLPAGQLTLRHLDRPGAASPFPG